MPQINAQMCYSDSATFPECMVWTMVGTLSIIVRWRRMASCNYTYYLCWLHVHVHSYCRASSTGGNLPPPSQKKTLKVSPMSPKAIPERKFFLLPLHVCTSFLAAIKHTVNPRYCNMPVQSTYKVGVVN